MWPYLLVLALTGESPQEEIAEGLPSRMAWGARLAGIEDYLGLEPRDVREPGAERLSLDSPALPPLPHCDEVLNSDLLFRDPYEGQGPLIDAASVALFVPNLVVEGLASLLIPTHLELNGQTLFDRSRRTEDFAATFFRQLVRKEQSFFARLGSTDLATFGVQDGTEEMDRDRFNASQGRLFFDVLKKSYRERFNIPSLDFDTALTVLRTGTWGDAVLVPAVLSAYTYRFGVDRKVKVSDDVRLEFHLDRGTRVYRTLAEDSHHHIASVSVNLFKLPVSLIYEIEGNGGRLQTGFAGIGTDLGSVMLAIFGAEAD